MPENTNIWSDELLALILQHCLPWSLLGCCALWISIIPRFLQYMPSSCGPNPTEECECLTKYKAENRLQQGTWSQKSFFGQNQKCLELKGNDLPKFYHFCKVLIFWCLLKFRSGKSRAGINYQISKTVETLPVELTATAERVLSFLICHTTPTASSL